MSNEHTHAATALAQAEAMDRTLRRKGRWLAWFQGIFGVVSLAMALGFAFLPPRTAMLVVMPVYAACIAGLVGYAAQQKTSLRGTMKHLAVRSVSVTASRAWYRVMMSCKSPWPSCLLRLSSSE